jgi:crotonobetainyl-CoA:carnitine CoA-transferase CaiB-like acyl-CoA transferase
MGAEVIKVEVPRTSPTSISDCTQLRSDRSSAIRRTYEPVEIDLKSDEGRELVHAMVADCDVFIQNFRTGVAERLGFGYEEIAKLNPKVVYCSISGFGGSGPQRSRRIRPDRKLESGVMSLSGKQTGTLLVFRSLTCLGDVCGQEFSLPS